MNLPVEQEHAVRVREAWGLGLGPIGNVVNLLESRGVLVTHIPEGCEDVDAFSTWHEGRPVVFLVMEKGATSDEPRAARGSTRASRARAPRDARGRDARQPRAGAPGESLRERQGRRCGGRSNHATAR